MYWLNICIIKQTKKKVHFSNVTRLLKLNPLIKNKSNIVCFIQQSPPSYLWTDRLEDLARVHNGVRRPTLFSLSLGPNGSTRRLISPWEVSPAVIFSRTPPTPQPGPCFPTSSLESPLSLTSSLICGISLQKYGLYHFNL